MSQDANNIKCPNCGVEIDVNEILYHQLDEELKKKYNDQISKERKELVANEEKLKAEREAIEHEKESYKDKLASAIQDGLKAESGKLKIELKKQAEEEQEERLAALQKELVSKSEQVKELNKFKADIERLKREKDELKDKIELEAQQQINKTLSEEKEKIRKSEAQKAQLNISEKEQIINQLKEQLQEAQRKADQGSMQLQGEVQELAIEEWLAVQFPLDSIDEIKKGERGADCMQTINTHSRTNCGTIYYESKRTKNFQPTWIEKFKSDIRDRNADIGVLVTEAMPAGMERLGLKDGIWICSFDEFKGLCTVLRESVIQLSMAITTQENKGEKMGMLYDFLTSNEFRLQIEAIVEGFTQMKTDLESEKRSMQGIWKKREKQIDKVLLNTNHMYSSIKGIAGSAVQSVALLELPSGDDTTE
ncbi:MAG: DUF2130 domain-containing protein [Candidatus Thiodiazotropha sp. 6PLUC2]